MGFSRAFGATFFYQVLLPGAILATALHPIVLHLYRLLGFERIFELGSAPLLAITALFAGLTLSQATRSAYYILEGFRWRVLTSWLKHRTEARLRLMSTRQWELYERRQEQDDVPEEEKIEAMLLAEKLRDFPIMTTNEGPVYFADRPTVLGNIIASYERYPLSRYGIDGEFFWFHALFSSREKVQETFEETQAIAVGMVLSIFAALLAALGYLVVILAHAFGAVLTSAGIFDLPPAPVPLTQALMLSALSGLLAILFYRLGLNAHREHGRVVRTMFDLTVSRLIKLGRRNRPTEDDYERLSALMKYLEWLYQG